MGVDGRPGHLPTREELAAQRATELARARVAAPAGKEPFRAEALSPYVAFESLWRTDATREQQFAARAAELEYEYYVLWPTVMTMREFGTLLESRDCWT